MQANDEPLIYSQPSVMADCNVKSATTWWRWRRDGVVPEPDIEIRGRKYYSAERRAEVVAAILSSAA